MIKSINSLNVDAQWMLKAVSQHDRTSITDEFSWVRKANCYFDELTREIDAEVEVICVFLLIKMQTILIESKTMTLKQLDKAQRHVTFWSIILTLLI